MKDRSCDWWDRIVSASFSDQQWRENVRMSQATFHYLCSELRDELVKKNTQMRSAVSVERRVAIALWCLTSNGDY